MSSGPSPKHVRSSAVSTAAASADQVTLSRRSFKSIDEDHAALHRAPEVGDARRLHGVRLYLAHVATSSKPAASSSRRNSLPSPSGPGPGGAHGAGDDVRHRRHHRLHRRHARKRQPAADDGGRARLEHTAQLGEAALAVGEEHDAEHREGGVEAALGIGQRLAVTDAGVDVGDAGRGGARLQARDHRRRKVERVDVRHCAARLPGAPARSRPAGDIDDAARAATAPPGSVSAEAANGSTQQAGLAGKPSAPRPHGPGSASGLGALTAAAPGRRARSRRARGAPPAACRRPASDRPGSRLPSRYCAGQFGSSSTSAGPLPLLAATSRSSKRTTAQAAAGPQLDGAARHHRRVQDSVSTTPSRPSPRWSAPRRSGPPSAGSA